MSRLPKGRLAAPYARLARVLEPAWRRYYPRLSERDLLEALAQLGVVEGATVMAHISMDEVRLAAPTVDALGLVRMLQELLGEEGTLLVPTFPFMGYEFDFAEANRVFDVRRTPSRAGLVTEVFRRLPETRRSLHPTHPVSGWGRQVEAMLSQHHEGRTFAETSPFCRLRELDGIVVGIGVALNDGFTILHTAEELDDDAREYAFVPEPFEMTVVDGDRSIEYDLHPLRRGLDRDIRRMETELLQAGELQYVRHSGLLLSQARADVFMGRCLDLMRRRVFYRSGPLSRHA